MKLVSSLKLTSYVHHVCIKTIWFYQIDTPGYKSSCDIKMSQLRLIWLGDFLPTRHVVSVNIHLQTSDIVLLTYSKECKQDSRLFYEILGRALAYKINAGVRSLIFKIGAFDVANSQERAGSGGGGGEEWDFTIKTGVFCWQKLHNFWWKHIKISEKNNILKGLWVRSGFKKGP